MTLKEKMHLLQRAQDLIRRKATGTPRELADRLEISERTWYRMHATSIRSLSIPR